MKRARRERVTWDRDEARSAVMARSNQIRSTRPRNHLTVVGDHESRAGEPLEAPVHLPGLVPELEIRNDVSERGARALQAARDLLQVLVSGSSMRQWRKRLTKYAAWCKKVGLPWNDPETVVAYLAEEYTGARDEFGNLLVDSSGRLVQRPLAWSTIQGDLVAINHLFESAELAPAGQAEAVKAIRKAIRKSIRTTRSQHRRPLSRDEIDLTIRSLMNIDLLALRDRVAIDLRDRFDWSLKATVSLNIGDVELEGDTARIRQPGTQDWREVKATGTDGCLVAGLHSLIARVSRPGGDDTAPLFTTVDDYGEPGDRLVLKTLDKAIARRKRSRLAADPDADWWGDLVRSSTAPSLIDTRDRALFLLGIASSSRGSNLATGCWADLAERPAGDLEFTWLKSKGNDDPHITAVPRGRQPGSPTDPVAAVQAWRDAISAFLRSLHKDRALLETDPIFCVIINGVPRTETCLEALKQQPLAPIRPCRHCTARRAGLPAPEDEPRCTTRRLVPMTPIDINNLVKRRLERVGVDITHVGAHSLRVTFATLAAEGGADLLGIKTQMNHKDVKTTAGYMHGASMDQFNTALCLGL